MRPFSCRRRTPILEAQVYDDETEDFLLEWLPKAAFYNEAKTMIVFRASGFNMRIKKGDYVVKTGGGFNVLSCEEFWSLYEL